MLGPISERGDMKDPQYGTVEKPSYTIFGRNSSAAITHSIIPRVIERVIENTFIVPLF